MQKNNFKSQFPPQSLSHHETLSHVIQNAFAWCTFNGFFVYLFCAILSDTREMFPLSNFRLLLSLHTLILSLSHSPSSVANLLWFLFSLFYVGYRSFHGHVSSHRDSVECENIFIENCTLKKITIIITTHNTTASDRASERIEEIDQFAQILCARGNSRLWNSGLRSMC